MKIKHLKITGVADYFAAPVLSNSSLKGAILKASADTLRTGQLLHLAVYEPDLFKASSEYKAFPNTNPVAYKRMQLVLRMADAARKNPLVSHFLEHPAAVFEKEFWVLITHIPGLPKNTAVPFRMKADALLYHTPKTKGKPLPAPTYCKAGQDLKSTSARTKAEFLAVFEEYGYWDQAATYQLITGARKFYFIGVTKSEPHQTFTVSVSDYPAEMKAAKARLAPRICAHLEANPDWLAKSLAFCEAHADIF